MLAAQFYLIIMQVNIWIIPTIQIEVILTVVERKELPGIPE